MKTLFISKKLESHAFSIKSVNGPDCNFEADLVITISGEELKVILTESGVLRSVAFRVKELGTHPIIALANLNAVDLTARSVASVPVAEVDVDKTLQCMLDAVNALRAQGGIDEERYASVLDFFSESMLCDQADIELLSQFLDYESIFIDKAECVVLCPNTDEVCFWAMVWPSILPKLRQLLS